MATKKRNNSCFAMAIPGQILKPPPNGTKASLMTNFPFCIKLNKIYFLGKTDNEHSLYVYTKLLQFYSKYEKTRIPTSSRKFSGSNCDAFFH